MEKKEQEQNEEEEEEKKKEILLRKYKKPKIMGELKREGSVNQLNF